HLRVRHAGRRERQRGGRAPARAPPARAARQGEPDPVQSVPGGGLRHEPVGADRALPGDPARPRRARDHPREPGAGHPGRLRAARRGARRGLTSCVPGIGVIVNPHARANRIGGAERARRLAEIVGGDGAVRVTESLPAIQDVAREFRERGTEVLAICGGDGSYHCTLTGFRAVYGDAPLPLLLPLRAGTINYISDAIGGRRGRPEQALARVVRDYRRGRVYETTERDLLRVNGAEHGFVLSFGSAGRSAPSASSAAPSASTEASRRGSPSCSTTSRGGSPSASSGPSTT